MSGHHVIIAGGGFAAVEALLALRAHAEERVTVELIAKDPLLRYRPSATGEPFGVDEVASFELAELAERAGADFRCDALTAVLPSLHAIRLGSGSTRRYDSLVVAIGARARAAIPGALTFRDQRDTHHLERVLEELRDGSVSQVGFTAPLGVAWTLPLYELALLTARRIDDEGLAATVTLVTPERRPLEVFGRAGSEAVSAVLAEQGVYVQCGARPRAVTREGLELSYGGVVPADRVIAVPQLSGPPISGVPSDWTGFISTDASGRVVDLEDVYAAGDLTTFAVKQGGLATQQADTVARAIAAEAGADVAADCAPYVLRARLVGGHAPLFLRAELDDRGRPLGDGISVHEELPWWPSGKVFGRHLNSFLAELAPAAA
jgi:sulfide:quinone oxidoreductase